MEPEIKKDCVVCGKPTGSRLGGITPIMPDTFGKVWFCGMGCVKVDQEAKKIREREERYGTR